MTLWSHPQLVREYVRHGHVHLIADDSAAKQWWENWLKQNKISNSTVSYFVVPTDSIWIRDYGPWFILHDGGDMGIVDTIYNRPRPNDDLVPGFIGNALNISVYKPALVHTGGNYYSDGVGNAFSSTLAFEENAGLAKTEVTGRMQNYLGIEHYTTSRLNPGISIEHLDTYGKLVSPDTWVFGEFPAGSRFRQDSEAMYQLLKTLTSPYGTPYKIYRLKMTPASAGSEEYRAYINSFISNGVLYYPTYGAPSDKEAADVYQKALPGYQVVGIDSGGTYWGDSIHCRSRNLLTRDRVFIFPRVAKAVAGKPTAVTADIFASPHAQLEGAPTLYWRRAGSATYSKLEMKLSSGVTYQAAIPAQRRGVNVNVYLSAEDSRGKTKLAPSNAPGMTIDFEIP
jgi:agmatine/peptidylarginine deiminase